MSLNEPTTGSMTSWTFTTTLGSDVSDELLADCATLFSTHYGVWGADGSHPGNAVKMPPAKLRRECMSAPERTVLSTCMQDGVLIGHAFGTVWDYEDGHAAWVTQLVVAEPFRRKYVATQLVEAFKTHPLFRCVSVIGVASSHPATIAIVAKYSNIPAGGIDTVFIAANVPRILAATPVKYLKLANVKLRGSLFESDCTTGVVSVVYTRFYLDHKVPQEALAVFKSRGQWCMGELIAGHEFLAVIPVEAS